MIRKEIAWLCAGLWVLIGGCKLATSESQKPPPDPVSVNCQEFAQRVNDAVERERSQPAKSFRVYMLACESNCAYGCEHLGYAYEKGAIVERDEQRAKAAFEKTCALDSSMCD